VQTIGFSDEPIGTVVASLSPADDTLAACPCAGD